VHLSGGHLIKVFGVSIFKVSITVCIVCNRHSTEVFIKQYMKLQANMGGFQVINKGNGAGIEG